MLTLPASNFVIREPYHPINIEAVEEKYNATYLGYWCLKTKGGGWAETPADIFYVADPDTSQGHSHYFGLFILGDNLMITRGDSAFEDTIVGAVSEEGEIVVSRYRHDYVTSKDGTVMIDGGRDYLRTNTDRLVDISVKGDDFTFRPRQPLTIKVQGEAEDN